MKTETLSLGIDVVQYANGLLSGTECSDIKDEVVFTFTQPITGTEYEVDINVVGCDGSYYVDAILFRNGHEVMCLEPQYDSLDGEYIFEVDGEVIVVNLITHNYEPLTN